MVAVSYDRKAILVTWDPGDYEGEVALYFTNPSDSSDVSNTDARDNDGEAVATVPATFIGAILCEVRDSDGNVIDSGTLSI